MSSPQTRFDLITLGESMWRLSPPGRGRLEGTTSLDIQVAGAESNVAVALARLGKRTAWWSRLPDNAPGRSVTVTLRGWGVDVSGVCWGGTRLGTYYVEFGSPPRPTEVIYDRAGSSASEMRPDDFDWSRLGEARWLHLTGITPALSDSCRETVRRALAEAKTQGLFVSIDLNYRARLWTPQECAPVLDDLAAQCSLVVGAERDVRQLFGMNDAADAPALARALHTRWNGATVVVTRGDAGAVAFDGTGDFSANAFPVTVVDPIGAGDAFDAGLFCGLLDGLPLGEALRWGTAVAALKMTIPGDLALVTRAEVEHVLSAGKTGVIR